jgi:hypothetical protein
MTQIDPVPAREFRKSSRDARARCSMRSASPGAMAIRTSGVPIPAEHPSWRWDECRRSIFDVVMRCGSTEFEAAKIRVALMIDRPDLIKPHDGEYHEAMDAASLLQPTTALRDDELARTYLSYRLGIPPGDVPIPITQVVGWKALPSFDPLGSRGGKPQLVGQYPYTIFETRAPDGRRYGHGIYLSSGGASKAELRRHLPNADIEFRRIGITREQADLMCLPTKPAKDRRGGFEDDTVEAEAMPAGVLRRILCEAIEDYIDPHEAAEASERELLLSMAANVAADQ